MVYEPFTKDAFHFCLKNIYKTKNHPDLHDFWDIHLGPGHRDAFFQNKQIIFGFRDYENLLGHLKNLAC